MKTWPRARSEPQISATLKASPADFVVRETLSFEPTGMGEHCLVHLEKIGLSTPELARLLADAHGLDSVDVGYAGMKDKHAITSQWFTLRGVAELDETIHALDGITVLAQTRHAQKLRKGQLRSNRFEVLLRELGPGDHDAALDRLRVHGAPNYFGAQRFGWDNVEKATAWLARRRRSRISKFKQGLYLSVLRGYLFNEVLGRRIAGRNWNVCIDGDRLCDGMPTGPLWGRGRSHVSGAAAALEAAALSGYAAILEGLEHAGLKQARRPLVLRAEAFGWQREGDALRLYFSLGPGAYATSFLGEEFDLASPARAGGAIAPGAFRPLSVAKDAGIPA